MYSLMSFHASVNDIERYKYAQALREDRTLKTRKKSLLKDMMELDPEYVKRLSSIGIVSSEEMLEPGKTSMLRSELSKKSGVLIENIVEMAKLSDIARIGMYGRNSLACSIMRVYVLPRC